MKSASLFNLMVFVKTVFLDLLEQFTPSKCLIRFL
jgi:hypothetical protein